MNVRTLAAFLLLFAIPAAPQTHKPAPAGPNSPVGHWMTEHTSKGGIGSWWDFRPDGTFTMHLGAMPTITIKRSGNTMTMPSPRVDGPPVIATYRVEGNQLYMRRAGEAADTSYTREGPAPSSGDALLGKWRPNPPEAAGGASKGPALSAAMLNELVIFSADGTQSVRIPFASKEGTWSAATHTFQFKGESSTHTFDRVGPKLNLGLSLDSQHPEAYLPDPIL